MRCHLSNQVGPMQVEREIAIHSSIVHPNIVDFYAAFEDDKRIYLVLEYAAGGDLFDIVKLKGGRLAESEVALLVIKPYLDALAYLHSNGIIHRDIKPENTVFTADKRLKVTDFGLSINQREERPVTRLGTLDYMSPEVILCPDKYHPGDNKHRIDLAYGERVDAWAMGILAYELVVGRSPFGMSDRERTIHAITSSQPSFPAWTSEGVQGFVSMALEKSPATRAPIQRLMHHPWLLSFETTQSSPYLAQKQKQQLMALMQNPALAQSLPLSSSSFSARSNPSFQQLFHTLNTSGHSSGGSGRAIEVPSISQPSAPYSQGHVGMPQPQPPSSAEGYKAGNKKVVIRRKQLRRSNTHVSGHQFNIGLNPPGLDPPRLSNNPVQGHQHRVVWADSVIDPQQQAEGSQDERQDLSQELTFSCASFSRSLSQSSKRRVPEGFEIEAEDLIEAARMGRILNIGGCSSGDLPSAAKEPSLNWNSLPPSLLTSPSGSSFRSGHQAHFASNLNPFGRPGSPSSQPGPLSGASPCTNVSKGSRLRRSSKVQRSYGGTDASALSPTDSGTFPQAMDAAAASSHQAAFMRLSNSLDIDELQVFEDDRPSLDLIAAAVAREWRGEPIVRDRSTLVDSRGSVTTIDPWSSSRTTWNEGPSFPSGGLRIPARDAPGTSGIAQQFASTNLNANRVGSGAVESGPHLTFNRIHGSSKSQSAAFHMPHPSHTLPFHFTAEHSRAGIRAGLSAHQGHQGHESEVAPVEQSFVNLFKSKSLRVPGEQRPSIFETFGRKPQPEKAAQNELKDMDSGDLSHNESLGDIS